MAGSVGAVACSRVIGFGRPLAERTQTWQIAGIDGFGVHLLGGGDSTNSFRAVYFGTTATCNTWYASLRALQGTIVSVTNEQGEVFANQLIQAVGEPTRKTANDLNSITTRFEVAINALTV